MSEDLEKRIIELEKKVDALEFRQGNHERTLFDHDGREAETGKALQIIGMQTRLNKTAIATDYIVRALLKVQGLSPEAAEELKKAVATLQS